MGILINLSLLILGTTGALAAFGGDTWRREPLPFVKRITGRGWLALTCMIATLCIGITKEIRSNSLGVQAALKEQELTQNLADSETALRETNKNYLDTKNALESTQKSLDSFP